MKRIIICCDGTWNHPGQRDGDVVTQTNVHQIKELISTQAPDGTEQLTYYHSGVGTSGNLWHRFMGGLDGEGLDNNIMDAYKFLVHNYEPGDHNFLFGFSRGAYTARSLAGFIVNCGILQEQHAHRIHEAFALYREKGEDSHPKSERARKFRELYSHPPAVYFVGVWDTVGDLGIPVLPNLWFGNKYKFHDTYLSSQIVYAYHALAIDEHRKLFNPTLWQFKENDKLKGNQTIEQRWFPGTHSNVGGSYRDSKLSYATLQWMIGRAKDAGMAFNEKVEEQLVADIVTGHMVNSNTFWWSLLNFFRNFYRTIFLHDQVFINQTVVPEVYQRIAARTENYSPPNLPPQNPTILQLAVGETSQLTINAADKYSWDMVAVNAGEQYRFECAPGQTWKDWYKITVPDGYFNPSAKMLGMRVKNAKCFCLCGIIDRYENTAFAIGSGCDYESERRGMISFFANDTPGFYFNNSGSIILLITRLA